jgi:hypothetical protein
MAKFISTQTHLRFLHTGSAEEYPREEGIFQVDFGGKVSTFKTLVAAYIFFHDLKENAVIWDVTEGRVKVESKMAITYMDN